MKKACRLLLSALLALLSTHAFAAAPRPNIILILADDLGFSDLGCYGGEISTPNLDALAASGLRYTQFYNTARCCPTRAALLTGLYPHQAGVGHMVDSYAAEQRRLLNSPAYADRLSPFTPTLAELLKRAGYRTSMAGKWHLGYRPAEWPAARGFDRSFVLIDGAMNYFGYGPQHFAPNGVQADPPMAMDGKAYVPPREGFFATDTFTDHALEFIREPRGRKSPFFLYLAYNAPHWPLQARPETVAACRSRYDEGWDSLREQRHQRLKAMGLVDSKWPLAPRPSSLPAWEAVSPERQSLWRDWMAVYAAQVQEMDTAIGRLMTALRDMGEDRNTLVLFLSDNGGAAERPVKTIAGAKLGTRESYEGYALEGAHVSSTPFRKTKKFTHEGGIATPLIAHWPAGIHPRMRGQLNNSPGHVIDLMATCLELAGAKLPSQWNGKRTLALEGASLTPSFQGRQIKRSRPLFWEHEGHRAAREGRWKIVSTFNQPWELYDLESDRTESTDLAAVHPDMLTRLVAHYEAWAARAGVVPWMTVPRK